MSRSGDGGGGYIPERFRSALAFSGDKPDTKHLSDLGSPVSPLHIRPAATQTSSSSSGSFAKNHPLSLPSAAFSKSHSGEISSSSDTGSTSNRRPGHRRTVSGPLFSGGGAASTATSPSANFLPTGNICPSGRIAKTGIAPRSSSRADVLGTGTGNYGHGSVMRGGPTTVTSGKSDSGTFSGSRTSSSDPQEVTKQGNTYYKKGHFSEALECYDWAIEICPGNAACRNNRAAALTGLGRLSDAVRECEEAVRVDPGYVRAHHRLATLYLRLGLVENVRKHLFLASQHPDLLDLQRLQVVERHLGRCAELRIIGDWKSALRETDAAIAAGADSSPLLMASKAEALIQLHQLDEAESTLSNALELATRSFSQTKFFGMISDSYMCIVRAKVDMALGRFENALEVAEKARQVDSRCVEVTMLLDTVRSVARARARGNDLFKSGDFAEASTAYGEGLRHDPLNPVLYCNRAVCRSKLEKWERSIQDCNEALRIHPSYKKARLRRAASFAKLERWAEAVRDYEMLRKELPRDTEVAESLFHAQVALKTSRGEEVSNMKFGGEVEEITSLEKFRAAVSLPGASVVYFMGVTNQDCLKITPFIDVLCTRYPSINFLKVDMNESPTIAKSENVRTVPTFKIYKDGSKGKEIICPSQQLLEWSVKHYGLS